MTETVVLANTALNALLLAVGIPILVRLSRTVTSIAARFERLEVAVLGIGGKGGVAEEIVRFRDWKHDEYAPWGQRIEARLAVVEYQLNIKGAA